MQDVYFKRMSDFIKSNQEWYGKRFSYSACELWLCVEICNILNFDHPTLSFVKTGENKCCFNEDNKRDLSIYNDDLRTMENHIEVKLLYPSYGKIKSELKINEVFDKFNNNIIEGVSCSGWFFFIWSSLKKGSFENAEDFFKYKEEQVKEIAKKNKNFKNAIPEIENILTHSFSWRNTEKEIVVKAMSLKNDIENPLNV